MAHGGGGHSAHDATDLRHPKPRQTVQSGAINEAQAERAVGRN